MAFPNDVLGTKVQMKINNIWTDVTRYDTNTKILQDASITIKRGQGGLQDRTPTSICEWTWEDPNGIYNNENPRSPYYGVLPRNTPVRVYVPRSEAAFYRLSNDDASRVQTTDKAALDITGDMELRFDFEPRRFTRWASGGAGAMFLGGKYVLTGNQRSWYVRLGDPTTNLNTSPLFFVWSTDGTAAGLLTANATVPLPVTTGRLAIKITVDVNNGGGSREIKFWTSTTGIDGTYTQLGATNTGAVTSIFASTANLELGTINGGALNLASVNSTRNFDGRIYNFRMYNGIGGSLVAEANFTNKANGTTSFADGLGNTWTTQVNAEITNADYRFHGEFSAPKIVAKRTRNGSGLDIRVQAEAGGLIRRLTANDTPIQSAIAFTFSTYNANGWWLGEDASNTDTKLASSGASDIKPASINDITFAGFDEGIAGSAGVMECGSTNPQFSAFPKYTDPTGELHFYGFFKFPSIPGSEVVLFTWYSNTFEVSYYQLSVTPTSYRLRGFDQTGAVAFNNLVAFAAECVPTNWMAYHSRTIGDGFGGLNITHEWVTVGTDAYQTGAVSNVAVGSTGRFTRVTLQGTGLNGVKFCHLMTSNKVGLEFFSGTPTTNVVNYARAFAGETADSRFRRICTLLGVTPVVIGALDDSELMGPQPLDKGMNVLYECAEVDGGKITEARDQLALEYRTRKSLYNQPDSLTMTWAMLTEGLEATPDDTDVANDILLERQSGGTARATLSYGPMSIQAPPAGISPVSDNPIVNNYTLEQLTQLAYAMLHKRTWPTARYPTVPIEMHRSPFAGNTTQFLAAQKLDITDVIRITSLPNIFAPEELRLMVGGLTEQYFGQEWYIDSDTVPYGPYVSSELQTVTGDMYSNFKASHHTIAGVVQTQLNASITNSATSIAVKTLSGPLIQQGAASFTIMVDGEFMTVTNVVGATSPQTLTVTRGITNGYAATHNANAYVYIYPTLKARL